MGPIDDQRGLKQGGINSGECYKIYGKEQVQNAQKSKLGVPLRAASAVISGIAMADDTLLTTNSTNQLQNLLQLTNNFCQKYHVELCVEKTKLQVMSTKAMKLKTDYLKSTSQIKINDIKLEFVDIAEHVGIIRSISGNLPHVLGRVTAHNRALGAVLHAGSSKSHCGNPAASLRVDRLYGVPVLLSGIAALVLKKTELEIIDHHHKQTIERLLKLLPGTPQYVSLFLAGSHGGTALVHLRQLSLFGMICRLPENVLNGHARHTLTVSKPSSKSWFIQIRALCLLYDLPHPITLLDWSLGKEEYKKMIKQHVSYGPLGSKMENSCKKNFHPYSSSILTI